MSNSFPGEQDIFLKQTCDLNDKAIKKIFNGPRACLNASQTFLVRHLIHL